VEYGHRQNKDFGNVAGYGTSLYQMDATKLISTYNPDQLCQTVYLLYYNKNNDSGIFTD